ncbi:MAG: eukaryotic-like serine/threonine-protein kinase [Acidobacteriota bacterium]|nr:eukaryotic-like serine/threonine-protein kinase [Acidobacteriota bacterium]
MRATLGPYRIVEQIAIGGMGEVYRAERTDDGTQVALKILRADKLHDAVARERFARESSVLARLEHPSIARLYGFGVDEVPYFAMELLEGETLAARLARGPLPPGQALACATRIAEALAYAHHRGIIHRDVKPSNIHLAGQRVVLSDFGVAFAVDQSRLTISGELVGTAVYVAPEILRNEMPTSASDVYSLGIVLFEALTGELPFRGESVMLQTLARLKDPPRRLRDVRPELPVALETLLQSCLLDDPARRPTARAVAEALTAVDLLVVSPRGLAPWLAGAMTTAGIALAIMFAASRRVAVPPVDVHPPQARIAAPAPLPPATVAATPAVASATLKITILSLGAETPRGYSGTRNLTRIQQQHGGFGVVSPGRMLRNRDLVAILIESSLSGYLYVLNAGSDGVVRNLYYGEPRSELLVDADHPRTLGPFRIEPPSGTDRVTFLLTPEPLPALEEEGDLRGALNLELARHRYGSLRREEVHEPTGVRTAVYFLDGGTRRIRAEVPLNHQ